ncbi:MAG: N-acetyltransferase [Lutibacter sp.]
MVSTPSSKRTFTSSLRTSGRSTLIRYSFYEKLKGQGAGKKLVIKAIEFAREKHLKIIPICTFAKSVFDKEIAFRDVL